MMNKKYIISLDSGTTSVRAIIFDKNADIVAVAQKEFTQYFPCPGWVEHNAEEILTTQLAVARSVIEKAGISPYDIDCCGITNQRETAVVWNKNTGKPICNAIVWQCRRTADYCNTLKEQGYGSVIKEKTGLVIDAYFSATKLKWILDNVDGAREQAEKGELLFGTIDCWLLWNLTGGTVHATDYTNASRTMLYNITELCWDNELLDLFDIPRAMLPRVMPSSCEFGISRPEALGAPIPICGIAGDQQAALFGQTCFDKGEAKNTYGTGCFMLLNTGLQPQIKDDGLITTIAWGIDGQVSYALEGSVFVGGAVIQWLRDSLGLISSAADSEYEALKLKGNDGVYIVPAFTGLGTPYWDSGCKGSIHGLTRGSGRSHIVRAALESIAYQSLDVIRAMERSCGVTLSALNVDGGACANSFLMQFQADILGVSVNRPACIESTALGAAYLSGLATGFFKSKEQIRQMKKISKTFVPGLSTAEADSLILGWRDAVRRTLSYES